MKRRIRFPLIGLVMTLAFAANPALAQHTACNCWEEDWICTTEDDNHNVVWYLFVRDGCP